MVFNSVVFLFCFLPLSLLLYYLVPGRAKNAVLLAESLIFYCWTGAAFLPLIAVLIVFNYLWALLTARAKSKLRGLLPLAAVLVNLGVLVYFKYANFLIDTVNQVAHLGLAALMYPVSKTKGVGHVSYRPLFFIVSMIMVAAVAILYLTIREPKLGEENRKLEAAHPEWNLATDDGAGHEVLPAPVKRSLAFLLLSISLWFIGYNGVTTWFTKYVEAVMGEGLGLSLIHI